MFFFSKASWLTWKDGRFFVGERSFQEDSGIKIKTSKTRWGFHIFFFSPLFGEDSHFDDHIFQMGWILPTRRDSQWENLWLEDFLKKKLNMAPSLAGVHWKFQGKSPKNSLYGKVLVSRSTFHVWDFFVGSKKRTGKVWISHSPCREADSYSFWVC